MSPGKSSNMVLYSVIIALFGCVILSADAIRCHQCNSHLDEDCTLLTLSIPRAIRDEQYLKDCEGDFDDKEVFCRKTISVIEATGENRIVRSCGWLREPSVLQTADSAKDRCFSADNEGYDHTICACYTDGCNAAPFGVGALGATTLGVALVASTLVVRYL